MRSLLLLLLIAVLLAVFNPGMDDFRSFVREKSGEMITGQTGEGRLGELLSGVGSSVLSSNVERVTRRENYYVFSTYTVDLDGPTGTENEWRFLGIATQFIELQRPEALRSEP